MPFDRVLSSQSVVLHQGQWGHILHPLPSLLNVVRSQQAPTAPTHAPLSLLTSSLPHTHTPGRVTPQAKDRSTVFRLMKEHVHAPDRTPLLVFPEGTCVNNEYCVMFKRGAFELDATVHPIAVKYNKIFVDAFWNSKRMSFTQHLVKLMTSWAVVCDVYFLEPQKKRAEESVDQFAARVQEMIAKQVRVCVCGPGGGGGGRAGYRCRRWGLAKRISVRHRCQEHFCSPYGCHRPHNGL